MLSKEEQVLELGKIRLDIRGFLKYVRIQEPGELSLGYELWPHLARFYEVLAMQRLIVLIKSKQIGISWALAIHALRRVMTIPGDNVLEISGGEVEAQKLLEKSQVVYSNLPEWLKRVYGAPLPNSKEQFGFESLKSKIRALPSTETAGIGETAGCVIHDEADFHDYFRVNLGHTLATVADNPARQLIIVSTVDENRVDTDFQRLYKAALDGKNNFYPLFFGCYSRPDRDEAWLEARKRENEATPWVVGKNFPRTVEEALSPISTQSCFKKERLEKLWNEVKEPDIRQGFIYILYPPSVGIQYVGGVDVGEGVGLDYSCLTIVGKRGLSSEVCAVIYSNEVATDLFAYEVDKLCREYFNPLLAIENNSLGIAVTNKVVELGYTNLYYSDDKRTKVGWTTGEKNKQLGIIELIQAINDGSLSTRFKPQVKEMMEYQWVNGKPTPTGATHGDTVISLMLCNQMLKKVVPKQEASLYIRGRRIF